MGEERGLCGEEAVLPGSDVEDDRFDDGYGGLGLQVVKEGLETDAFVGGVLVDQNKEVLGLGSADAYEDEFLVDLGDDLGGLKSGFGEAGAKSRSQAVEGFSDVGVRGVVTGCWNCIEMKIIEEGLRDGLLGGWSEHWILPFRQQVFGPGAWLRSCETS